MILQVQTSKIFCLTCFCLLVAQGSIAQRVVPIRDSVEQYIFSFSEIEYLEDPEGKLSLPDVQVGDESRQFKPSVSFSPINFNRNSSYWYRITIKHDPRSKRKWQLEFFDQTIDHVDAFVPGSDGQYKTLTFGDEFPFSNRFLKHKNFIIHLANDQAGTFTYYFRIRSRQQADVLIVLRPLEYFFNYALDEYFFFGIFYGMILVFCFYNLLMFIAVHERHYLYYILYLLGIGLYEMSADGIAFQYLWPESVRWNQYAPGFFLYMASSSALVFSASLLNLRNQYKNLLWILIGAFIVRTVYLAVSLWLSDTWFNFRFIEVIPLGAAFYTGIYAFRKGYRPARFMVVGYSFLSLGVAIKAIQYLDLNWLPLGELTHYSLGFSFIMEMLFFSFAISDKIKVLRMEKDLAQQKTIEQLEENQKLKDSLNEELDFQVKVKTRELVDKTSQIEEQNRQLADANQRLAFQAEEIAKMNALLFQHNKQLQHDVDVVKEARILSREVDFEEFSAMYPDDMSCLKFLSAIKWQDGFACVKCNHVHFSEGRTPYSKRCTRCGYDESVTAYTILQNTRIPINKAFYMIFLVYSSKGNISSHKLSEILQIRQSTCWSYSAKIKKAMKTKQKNDADRHEGWDSILLMEEEVS